MLPYEQILNSPTEKEMAKRLGYEGLGCDACSEFWVRRMEDFDGFIDGEEYRGSLCECFCPRVEDGRKLLIVRR